MELQISQKCLPLKEIFIFLLRLPGVLSLEPFRSHFRTIIGGPPQILLASPNEYELKNLATSDIRN